MGNEPVVETKPKLKICQGVALSHCGCLEPMILVRAERHVVIKNGAHSGDDLKSVDFADRII